MVAEARYDTSIVGGLVVAAKSARLSPMSVESYDKTTFAARHM